MVNDTAKKVFDISLRNKVDVMNAMKNYIGSIENYLHKDGQCTINFTWVHFREGAGLHKTEKQPEGVIVCPEAADFEGTPIT